MPAKRLRSSPTGASPAATRGFCIGHVGPEAAVGGPIGLVKDGDIISIDAERGTLDLEVSSAELERRRADLEGAAKCVPDRGHCGNSRTKWGLRDTGL